MSQCPNLKGYLNQYGYALYNKFINVDDEKIKENETLFFSVLEDILDVCKQERYSPMEPSVNRAIKYLQREKSSDYEKLIEMLNLLDPNLLDDKPFTNSEGKEFESKKERYYRLKVKALYDAKKHQECVQTANNALSLPLKWHFNTLQWINYQRACSLVELEQFEEAKKFSYLYIIVSVTLISTKFFIKQMLTLVTLKKLMLTYYMNSLKMVTILII